MKQVTCTKEEFLEITGKHRVKWFEVIDEFDRSGDAVHELIGYAHKTAASCQASLLQAIKIYRKPHIKVKVKGDRVWLYKPDLIFTSKK